MTSWHQLIRREMIFKGLLSMVTADPLTLSLRFAAMGVTVPMPYQIIQLKISICAIVLI